MLSNGEDFEDMEEFGKQRLPWLKEILELPNGIPSHDTFNRFLQIIEPEELITCMQRDGAQLLETVKGKLINFDGKKLRGVSPKSRGNKGLYILSAWVSENSLCIGQKKVDDKSNEITAIPELLDALDVKGSTVTIDAIGCQKEIAEKIRAKGAHYLLSVKENQKGLHEEISEVFNFCKITFPTETWEYDHGRFEERTCQILPAVDTLSPLLLESWKDITTIVKIISKRVVNNVTSLESRYYISSDNQLSAYYNEAVRGHWGIENELHWHLDVSFNEDKSRARSGNAPQNLNILRKIALHKITRKKDNLSVKKRRYRASLNKDYLEKILLT